MGETGLIDQAHTIWVSEVSGSAAYQRPALLHIRRNNKGYYAI